MDFVQRFDGSSISFNYRCPNSETKYVRTDRQTDKQTNKQTNRQTDICLQKIYVEGPVQNNEKTKIKKRVWDKDYRTLTGLKIR